MMLKCTLAPVCSHTVLCSPGWESKELNVGRCVDLVGLGLPKIVFMMNREHYERRVTNLCSLSPICLDIPRLVPNTCGFV